MMYQIEGKYKPYGSALYYSNWYILYLTCKSLYTANEIVWASYFDMGLLRTTERSKFGLRDKLLFPVWFYYFAALTDLLIKCEWAVTAGMSPYEDPWINSIWFTTFEGVL